MNAQRLLIVNADDFGLSASVNQGIIEAHRDGVVTSTSLMVTAPHVLEAAALAKANPNLGVGLHINLSCGKSAADPAQIPHLVDKNGRFHSLSKLLIKLLTGGVPKSELATEIGAQFDAFKRLGIPCTHFDGHRHVHCVPQVFAAAAQEAMKRGIKRCRISYEKTPWAWGAQDAKAMLLRYWTRRSRRIAQNLKLLFPEEFFGIVAMSGAPGTNIFLDLVTSCRRYSSEIMCHPGLSATSAGAVDEDLDGYHSTLRQRDLDCLKDPRLKRKVEEMSLKLVHYAQLQ